MKPASSSIFSGYFFFTGAILFTGALLKIGSSLFVPLGYAFFLSIVLYPVCHLLEKKGLSRQLAITIGLILLLALISILILLFSLQLQHVFAEWPLIYAKLSELLISVQAYLLERFGISNEQVLKWLEDSLNGSISSSVGVVGTTLQSLLVDLAILALIPVYTFLILFYRSRLVEFLLLLLPGQERSRIIEVIQLSVHTYFKFIKGMALVYFLVGTLNSVGLWLMGIPYAFLFGYLTAVMTFIPYVGIIVASILPITYAWISYGVIWYPLGVVALFAVVQYLEANIIFPWAVGQRLELNTLATLIVIVVGGIIWGASGMILFIPFAAILKLVADRMPGWEALAMFLSNGAKSTSEK
jgi:predicted PurR-regulated permease PerM